MELKLPLYDIYCESCQTCDTEIIRLSEIEGWSRACDCGGKIVRSTVPFVAPAIHADANDYDAQISKMKRSFNQRFIKRDLDDVRHKFGSEFDDSLVGAATSRIKSGNA